MIVYSFEAAHKTKKHGTMPKDSPFRSVYATLS
jgi:hypothetical protein